jgi:hypothetical protein
MHLKKLASGCFNKSSCRDDDHHTTSYLTKFGKGNFVLRFFLKPTYLTKLMFVVGLWLPRERMLLCFDSLYRVYTSLRDFGL